MTPPRSIGRVLLVERLLRDPGFRRRFREDPASACRVAGLDELVPMLGETSPTTQPLEPRRLRSAVAGVMLAAAVQAVGLEHAVREVAPQVRAAGADALERIDPQDLAGVLPGRGAPPAEEEPVGTFDAVAPVGEGVRPPGAADAPVPVPAPGAAPGRPEPLWVPAPPIEEVPAAEPEPAPEARTARARRAAIAPRDYPGDTADRPTLARWMAGAAEAAELPAELPVMAALTESGLRNLPYGDRDSVGFFQMRLSLWDRGAYAGYLARPERQLRWFVDQAVAVRDARVAAGDERFGEDSEDWGTWIADVERPAYEYRGRYADRLAEARELLEAPPSLLPDGPLSAGLGAGGLPGSGPRAEALADRVLEDPNITLDARAESDLRAGRVDPRVSAVLASIAERHAISVTVLQTGHSYLTAGGSPSNHSFGRAMDIGTVDGQRVEPGNRAARVLTEALDALPRDIRPTEIGSPWAMPGSAHFTDAAHQDHLHIAFDHALRGQLHLGPARLAEPPGVAAAPEPVVPRPPKAVDPEPAFRIGGKARATAKGEPPFRARTGADRARRDPAPTRDATAAPPAPVATPDEPGFGAPRRGRSPSSDPSFEAAP